MSMFQIGDRVRRLYNDDDTGPKKGEEFIITCVDDRAIGFVSQYPLRERIHLDIDVAIKEGKEANWWKWHFELVQSAEDIDFNNRIKEIINGKSI